jgi:SAM-dependent methyltransferase
VEGQAGGWETWEWDESLFAGAAEYYEQGRLPYAPGLADALAEHVGLDGSERLLDVGCGPGTVTLRLASFFKDVVGVDPDRAMLVEAARLADERGVRNAAWVQMRAEELPAGLGIFRLVTFAASFHWMDRPRVAAAVKSMLTTGGAVVQVDAPGYRIENLNTEARRGTVDHPLPSDSVIDELRRRYLGANRRAGRSTRNNSPSGEDEVFQAAGFLPVETAIVPDQRIIDLSIDDIVAKVFSTSSSTPHLFGEHVDAFENDLRALLVEDSPSGLFSVQLPDNILRIWRVA